MFVLLALVNRSTLCNPLTSLRHVRLGLSSVAAFIESVENKGRFENWTVRWLCLNCCRTAPACSALRSGSQLHTLKKIFVIILLFPLEKCETVPGVEEAGVGLGFDVLHSLFVLLPSAEAMHPPEVLHC